MTGWSLFFASALAGSVSLLSSCQTMSAEECATADWRALGYQDATNNGASAFTQRSESCARRGVSADAVSYEAGVTAGMLGFCAPQNGFRFGRSGREFTGICPADMAKQFYEAYSDGRRVHQAQQDLQTAQSRVSFLEGERRRIDNDIGSNDGALAAATTDEDRARYQAEISRLTRERRRVNDDVRVAQAALPGLQRAISDLRYETGSRWGPW